MLFILFLLLITRKIYFFCYISQDYILVAEILKMRADYDFWNFKLFI